LGRRVNVSDIIDDLRHVHDLAVNLMRCPRAARGQVVQTKCLSHFLRISFTRFPCAVRVQVTQADCFSHFFIVIPKLSHGRSYS
jgi:hypothetical protein